ncbi:MAG TPA: barstar family protein [Oleiagrimonas sp.]|nr:barstar family protein [Oleiagrimonas sp.]
MNERDFRIDLTDLSACGVYYVTPEDIDTLDSSVDQNDFNVHHVNLGGCRNQTVFTERLAAGLSLPDSYGEDWPALIEYLQGMDGLPSRGHVVLFTQPHEWQQADPDGMGAALDVLEETAAIWAGEGVAFFVFLPQDMSTLAAASSA